MSSANRRLHIGLPPIEINVWWPQSVSRMILSRNKVNRMGESKYPWRTPILLLPWRTFFADCSRGRTALLEFSYSIRMAWISFISTLKFLRTCNRPACQTLSNAFLKSMKLWNRSRGCCGCLSMMTRPLKICSTVLRLYLKAVCFSASSASAWAWSLLRIAGSMILLGWLIRLMAR